MGEEVGYILQGTRNLRGEPGILGYLNESINVGESNMSKGGKNLLRCPGFKRHDQLLKVDGGDV